jgi:hypothetical protein
MIIGLRVEKAEKSKDKVKEKRRKEVALKEKKELEIFESVIVRLGRLRFRQRWLEGQVSGSLTLVVMGVCVLVGVLLGFVGGWCMAGVRGGEGVMAGYIDGVMDGRNWSEGWQHGEQVRRGLGWSMERYGVLSGIPSVVI